MLTEFLKVQKVQCNTFKNSVNIHFYVKKRGGLNSSTFLSDFVLCT
jgi:hypothetical protein